MTTDTLLEATADVVRTIEPVAASSPVAEFNQTASALAALTQRYSGVVFEVTTATGMKAAKAGSYELRVLRSDLEKRRVAIKAPLIDQGRVVDSEAKRIDAELQKLKAPIDELIKAEEVRKEVERIELERAEQKRIAAIQAKLADIRNLPLAVLGKNAGEILQLAQATELIEIEPAFFGGYANEASIARNAAAAKLRQAYLAQSAFQLEQARLKAEQEEVERVRFEQCARDEQVRIEREAQERIERLAQEAAERQIREKQEAELCIQREEIARLQAEQRAREQQAQLEREAIETAARLVRQQQEAVVLAQREEIERLQAAEKAQVAKEIAERLAREAAAKLEAIPAPIVVKLPVDQFELLEAARSKLVQFKLEYASLTELVEVIRAIDHFIAQ